MSRKPAIPSHEEARLLVALQEDGCPVCYQIAENDATYFAWFFMKPWREWVSWLDGTAPHGDRLDDVLPTCSQHVCLAAALEESRQSYEHGHTGERRRPARPAWCRVLDLFAGPEVAPTHAPEKERDEWPSI